MPNWVELFHKIPIVHTEMFIIFGGKDLLANVLSSYNFVCNSSEENWKSVLCKVTDSWFPIHFADT